MTAGSARRSGQTGDTALHHAALAVVRISGQTDTLVRPTQQVRISGQTDTPIRPTQQVRISGQTDTLVRPAQQVQISGQTDTLVRPTRLLLPCLQFLVLPKVRGWGGFWKGRGRRGWGGFWKGPL